MSQVTKGKTVEVTSYQLDAPLSDGVHGPHDWLAIATAHRYEPNPDTGGILTPDQAILAGAVLEVVEGRATAASEEGAMLAAVRALVFQWTAKSERTGAS